MTVNQKIQLNHKSYLDYKKNFAVPVKWNQTNDQGPLGFINPRAVIQKIGTVPLIVGFYFVTSLAVVFLNKFILSSSPKSLNLPLPYFVTYLQIVVAFVILLISGQLGKRSTSLNLIPPFEFDTAIARKVAPLTATYVCMLALNNACLMHVEVTFYQVARSLSLVFTCLLTKYILDRQISSAVYKACGVVFVGFVLGSIGEVHFTYKGVLFGVASSFFVALYGINVKRVLAHVDNNQWRLLHYNSALSLVFMVPFMVLSGELQALPQYSETLSSSLWWLLITFTGVTGFLINTAVFLQIKFTSPLTNTISGTAKACVQTVCAAIIFGNPISLLNATGIVLCLAGTAYYSFVKYREGLSTSKL